MVLILLPKALNMPGSVHSPDAADAVGTLGRDQLSRRLWASSGGALPRCLNYVLEELKHNSKAKVMVASHNEDTVRFTLHR